MKMKNKKIYDFFPSSIQRTKTNQKALKPQQEMIRNKDILEQEKVKRVIFMILMICLAKRLTVIN